MLLNLLYKYKILEVNKKFKIIKLLFVQLNSLPYTFHKEGVSMLGSKIRTLRKALGLTQSELAGNHMTKGMLSQIENGKAAPSMSTLEYLAKQLGCEPSDLLDEKEDYLPLLEEIKNDRKKENYSSIYGKLSKIVSEHMPRDVIEAKLYSLYAEAGLQLNKPNMKNYIEWAAAYFQTKSLFLDSAEALWIYHYYCQRHRKWEESLACLSEIRKQFTGNGLEENIVFQLRLFLDEGIDLLALEEYEKAHLKMMDAITLSKETNVYTRMDDIYRIAASYPLMMKDEKEFLRLLTKSEQYAIFSENKMALMMFPLLYAVYHNEITKDYKKALTYLEDYAKIPDKVDELYYLEYGKALYGLGKIEQALESLRKCKLSNMLAHPIDIAMVYTAGVYIALCLNQQGYKKEALEQINKTCDLLEIMPKSVYYKFANEVRENLIQEKGN